MKKALDLKQFTIFSSVKSLDEICDFIAQIDRKEDLLDIYFNIITINNYKIKEEILKHKKIKYTQIRNIVFVENDVESKIIALKYLVEKSPIISNPDLGFILFYHIFKLKLNLKIFFNFFKITFFPFIICGLLLLPFQFLTNFDLERNIYLSLFFGLLFSNIFWFGEKRLNWMPLVDMIIFFLIGLPLMFLSLPLIIPAFFVFYILSKIKFFQ